MLKQGRSKTIILVHHACKDVEKTLVHVNRLNANVFSTFIPPDQITPPWL